MADGTPQGAEEQTNAPGPDGAGAPAPPAPPAPNRDELDRIAAAARREEREKLERQHSDAMKKLEEKVTAYEQAEKERQQSEMTDLQKAQAEAKEAKEAAEEAARQAQAARDDLARVQREARVARFIADAGKNLPPVYHAAVYAQLAEGDEVTREVVGAALDRVAEQWQADLKAFSPSPPSPEGQAPAPQDVGSPGSPAGQPPGTPVPPEEQEAADLKLVERMWDDPDALKAVVAKYGGDMRR